MKIDVLRLIEDALIGGKQANGYWVENNPFFSQLFQESGKDFKDFLSDCINDVDLKENTQVKMVEYIIKTVKINTSSIEYSEYKKSLEKENEARREVNKNLKLLAYNVSPLLEEISTYKIDYSQSNTYVEYKILPSLIKEIK